MLGKMGARGGYASLGLLGGANKSPYSAEALAVFAAFTTPPTDARKVLIDTAIKSLKTAGIWSQLDVLSFLAAADSQAARINWINPAAFTALAVNSPTFVSDRGYTGDGSTSRLRTQYTPSVNGVKYTQDNASVWEWIGTNVAENSQSIGNFSAPFTGVRATSLGGGYNLAINQTLAYSAGANQGTSIGLSGAQRVSSSTIRAWKNGVQSGADVAVASTGVPIVEQWICGANSSSFSTQQISFAVWGASISGKEAALYNAVLAYLQGVGAA